MNEEMDKEEFTLLTRGTAAILFAHNDVPDDNCLKHRWLDTILNEF